LTTPLVDVRHLTYRHPDGTLALNDISLEVPFGANLAILGPNGSGKTTLILHLNGTLRGTGSVHIAGLEVVRENIEQVRRRVGVVFQNADEQLFMPTVLDDVMFGPLNLGFTDVEAQARAFAALQEVGIARQLATRAPYHLSAGEKRRVALAGVLAMDPEVLVLDEPTTSLDPPGRRALLDLLSRLPHPKIVCTHDIGFASAVSQRAVFLINGQVAGDGPVAEIVARFGWD
jgi:cobalt/nickel transport system ATP-binding protein